MKKEKIKNVKLPMKFNPGLQRYEPVLPLKKTGKNVKLKIDLKMGLIDKIVVITILILITASIIFLTKFSL